ncbi:hypothetical protein [Mastigocoleus testarum]|uniref:hypothetical protein n=1 Tax=Mastigocoleus testarum TaxID=996925 RepID=UPI0003F5DA28|nr:hypothetical protein [Mastigocoleus testarum]
MFEKLFLAFIITLSLNFVIDLSTFNKNNTGADEPSGVPFNENVFVQRLKKIDTATK